jgi:hypothetical protein
LIDTVPRDAIIGIRRGCRVVIHVFTVPLRNLNCAFQWNPLNVNSS